MASAESHAASASARGAEYPSLNTRYTTWSTASSRSGSSAGEGT